MPGLVLVLGERTVHKTALKKICPVRTFCGEGGQYKITFMSNNHIDKKKIELWLRNIALTFFLH